MYTAIHKPLRGSKSQGKHFDRREMLHSGRVRPNEHEEDGVLGGKMWSEPTPNAPRGLRRTFIRGGHHPAVPRVCSCDSSEALYSRSEASSF
jgi:hypothetical protein